MNKEDFENSEGLNHLEYIYNRMIEHYGANPNIDYMIKFKKIIDAANSTYFKKWYENEDNIGKYISVSNRFWQGFCKFKHFHDSTITVSYLDYGEGLYNVNECRLATEDEVKDIENNLNAITISGLEYKEVVSPKTGRIWLDRNIGAKQVATSIDDEDSYGDYLAWDEANDLANSVEGWRLPTLEELLEESKEWQNNKDAFNSFLRLPSAVGRYYGDGSMGTQGSYGNVWSSSVNNKYLKYLSFSSDNADWSNDPRACGLSVRLIKDIE